MDLIDLKFQQFRDRIYKLGIRAEIFKDIVEGNQMFEWSAEVGLALSMKHCSWIVQEDQKGEDQESFISLEDLRTVTKSENVIEKIRQSVIANKSMMKSGKSGNKLKIEEDFKKYYSQNDAIPYVMETGSGMSPMSSSLSTLND